MIRFLPRLLLLAVLAGCAPAQRPDTPQDWVARNNHVASVSGWKLDGRIGLQLEDRGFNGVLNWQQTGEEMVLNFHGPLGAGAFRVTGTPGALVLESGDGETYLFDDPEGALSAQLGWGVPLDALRFWIVGLPHPGNEFRQLFGDDGRLVALEQLGWLVEYQRYQDAEGWQMPRKMSLVKEPDLRVRLVISRWSFQ